MKTYIAAAFILATLVPQSAYSLDRCQAIFDRSLDKTQVARPVLETDMYFVAHSEGVEEHSIRTADTAAHVYLDSSVSNDPYLFVAYPSGNTGIAVWFKSIGKSVIQAIKAPTTLTTADGLNGVQVDLKTASKELQIDDTILGSMRFVRDRELGKNVLVKALGKLYDRIMGNQVTLENGKLIYSRRSLSQLARYRMEIQTIGDTQIVQDGEKNFRLVSKSEVKFKLTSVISEKPLTPIALRDFFKADILATMDPHRLIALSFLAYEEKLMAGSPRYFTKFGRDSIFTLFVFMDAMKPEAIERLLAATINSMDPRTGLVSHEQHEGDFAAFVRVRNKKKGLGVNTPIEDRKMLDDDMAFVQAITKYMKEYPERAKTFLADKDVRGYVRGATVEKLFGAMAKKAKPFAEAVLSGKVPKEELYKYLVGLNGHEKTGQWRDSDNGLGDGIYPFDVNTVFMPGSLKSMAELYSDKNPNNVFFDQAKADQLNRLVEVWSTQTAPLFEERIAQKDLEQYAIAYYERLGLDPKTLPPVPQEDIVFSAISIDKNGKRVPIMHSDDSLMMTFGNPTVEQLKLVSQRVRLPFPYGLKTEIGILVANPIFASADLQSRFGDLNYHGTVIWTMQEDLLVFGMARQIARPDSEVPKALKKELRENIRMIEKLIKGRGDLGGVEVFTVGRKDGKVVPLPFSGDAKGNSNQLWGHLRLIFPHMFKQMRLKI